MATTTQAKPLERRETSNLIGSDKVEGTPVCRPDGERVGQIERIMIDKLSGKVAYAVMSCGGFLVGEDYYPLPWSRNVVVSLGEPHDPKLPPRSVDIAILVHMYHEIEQPYALLYNLVPALKPEARVGIVDAFAPTSKHGTPPSLLRCEVAAVGYREISFDRLIGSDAYLAIFAPPSVASRTRPEAIVTCKAE